MTHTNQSSQAFLERAYALDGASAAQALYDEWATSYDENLSELDYAFPERAVSALMIAFDGKEQLGDLRVLDVGCGTGIVGTLLLKKGFKTIDGLDISTGMLEQAKKTGAYSSLNQADLTQPLGNKEGEYNVVICVGTFTKGHLAPDPALTELVRVVEKGGCVVFTVLEEIWESGGFKIVVDELVGLGKVTVTQSSVTGITKGSTDDGRILVLQKP